ncbi:HAG group protein [Cavenderia fasciculata]|uniref:HAG group protein n=1 Tax=Cavenderia fasciculata TaxID=261658 RepID=F4Q8P0_CACFS|nr:HAG group protein [Cavenderia fasciculata]EGG15059.1 HAG group protein [Cavenderia fasciculata]|eukprot:XP_004351779.1 HAG group protein [Cavenderia fasciculata]
MDCKEEEIKTGGVFEIKPCRKEDIQKIYDMIYELAVFEKLQHMVTGTVEGLEKSAFGEEKSIYINCGWYTENGQEQGQLIGYTIHFLSFSTFLCRPGIFLEDLYIKPEYRGKGLGKKLLLHLTKIAQDKGYGRVEWQCLTWNVEAQKLYNSTGAEVMDGWMQYRLVEGPQIQKCAKDFENTKTR